MSISNSLGHSFSQVFGNVFCKASILSVILFPYPLSCFCEQSPAVIAQNAQPATPEVSETEKKAEASPIAQVENNIEPTSEPIVEPTLELNATAIAEATPSAAQGESKVDPVSEEFAESTLSLTPIDKVCSSYLLAQKEDDQETPTYDAPTPLSLASRVQIGGNYTRVSFKPHNHQTFTGNLGGMQALYEYRPLHSIYGGVKFVWKEGVTHASSGKRSFLYFDMQERLGYTFATQAADWQTTLFTGLGYHRVGQKFSPKEGDSIRFNYNEFYFPVGMLTNYDFTSCFAVGANLTWMPQVYPTVSIVPLKGSRWTLTKRLINFYAELPLTFSFAENKRFQIILNPFYERWQDGHTTAKLSNGISLGVPGNTYNFYGVELNFAYRF